MERSALNRCCVCAGELSGDQHLARVVSALRQNHPHAQFLGMAGKASEAEGVELVVDADKAGGIMGFQELLGGMKQTLGALGVMKQLLESWKPDLLIIVDYPDFNLRLARHARRLGIKVLYYIPPKVWAWRKGRVRLLERYVDRIATIFPFEDEFLRKQGFRRSTYVGHPSVEQCRQPGVSRGEFLRQLGLDPGAPTLLAMPGSRKGELDRHGELVQDALEQVWEKVPGLQVILGAAPSLSPAILEKRFSRLMTAHPGRFVICSVSRGGGNLPSLLRSADVGLLKSGTCNIEAALCGLPFVTFFKLTTSTEFIVRRLVVMDQYTPVNIVRKGTVTELFQEDASSGRLSAEVESLLLNSAARRAQQDALSEVKELLTRGEGSPSERVARIVDEVLAAPRRTDVYKRVLGYLFPYRKSLVIALLAMVVFGASDGVIPFIVQRILDGVFANQNKQLLVMLPIAIMIFAFVRAAADFGQQYLMSKIGHEIIRDLRAEMEQKILQLDPSYFVRSSIGDLLSRMTSDVLLVRTLLTETVTALTRDAIRLVALIFAALYLDWMLATIALIVVPFGFLPIYRLNRKMRRLSRVGQDAIGALSGVVQESIQGTRVVKIFGRETAETERFNVENERLSKTFIRSEWVRALSGPVNEVLASFAISGVILYGGYSVISGERSQGGFLAFLIAVFLLYEPFKKISKVSAVMQQGAVGAERIFELLDVEPKVRDPIAPMVIPKSNDLLLEGVGYSYEENGTPVLSDVTLSIKEGEKVALVGLSGSGKSTLVDLFPRFIDPTRGRVLLGGIDIRTLKIAELRERMAMVSQHTFLFNDTVFANIAYGREGATREDVERAASAASALEFVNRLPLGLETMIGEGGYSLSGGERQRIAIARAILKDAPILILDEATASLDNRSERDVQMALEQLERGRTSIIVAHRLSTIRDADRIVVMQGGRIVEQGTHDELLVRGEEYSRLYQLQFRHEEPEAVAAVQ